ncbi:PIN2/TERF1-interacting telomerase inhibitor 1 [Gaertneriomyces sp. JEL0708]|nr:PIN2/TERF1-interacting telomerase inhibitor 1 [Gaertneriomyces sp. JEL0708]
MGLAGPKNKQRLGLDPQNKAWVGDKSKFGYKMLQKMGWSEGTGLGLHGHGQTEHVKVRLKEDTLGVGAEKRSGDNWLENNSGFEELLKKLNSETNNSEGNDGVSSVKVEVEVREVRDVRKVGRLYHRQKFLRNKLVSNYDQKDLSMILGAIPGAAAEVSASPAPSSKESSPEATPTPPLDDDAAAKDVVGSLLTTAPTNVHDYFKMKMAALGLGRENTDATPSNEDRASLGLGAVENFATNPVDITEHAQATNAVPSSKSSSKKEKSSKRDKRKSDKKSSKRSESTDANKDLGQDAISDTLPAPKSQATDESASSKDKKRKRKEKEIGTDSVLTSECSLEPAPSSEKPKKKKRKGLESNEESDVTKSEKVDKKRKDKKSRESKKSKKNRT